MRRREALGRILGAAALPLIGAGCDFDRLLAARLRGGGCGLRHTDWSGRPARDQRRSAAPKTHRGPGEEGARCGSGGDGVHGRRPHPQRHQGGAGPVVRADLGPVQEPHLLHHRESRRGLRDPRGAGYYGYTGAPGYQATTLGSWRLYSLNCFPATRGGVDQVAQVAWLKADLAANPGKQIAAFFHYPMFSSVCEYHTALHDGVRQDMTWKGRIGPWWKLLQAAGCSFAVSGHAHRYERLRPMLADGTVSDAGIRQYVCGTAGVKLRNIVPPPHPASEKIIVAHGVVRFDLYPDRYEWIFTDEWGVVSDQGAEPCRKVLA